MPLAYGLVLEEGRTRVTDPFALKVTCFLVRWDWDDKQSQVSHVNSPAHKNPANATHKAALMLSPLPSLLTSRTIRSRMSAVRGSLMRRSPSLCMRLPPRMTRSMRGSSKAEVV